MTECTEVHPLPPTWRSWAGVQGGYLAALLAATAGRAAGGAPLRSLHAVFLRAARGTSCRTSATVVRRGRSSAVVRADAGGEDGDPLVTSLVLFGDRAAGPTVAAAPPPPVPGPADCGTSPFPADLVPFTQHLEIRSTAGALPSSGGTEPCLLAWIRVRQPLRTAEQTLLVLVDALPPALYGVGTESVAVPSADLGVHLVPAAATADPAGWHLVRMRTEAAGEGWCVDASDVWSASGTLLASARQSRRVLA